MKTVKKKWQKCSDPLGICSWITPPTPANQTVLVSYASGEDGVIFRRRWNHKTGKCTYAKRLLAEDELFEPWQQDPG